MQPDIPPPRVKPKITAAPRAGQLYWCQFWDAKHAQQPEFYKLRPVVILSHNNQLFGHCLVLPASTKPQSGKWARRLSVSIDGQESWIVCNHIYTVATSRLQKHRGVILKVPTDEFAELLRLAHRQFPMPK